MLLFKDNSASPHKDMITIFTTKLIYIYIYSFENYFVN